MTLTLPIALWCNESCFRRPLSPVAFLGSSAFLGIRSIIQSNLSLLAHGAQTIQFPLPLLLSTLLDSTWTILLLAWNSSLSANLCQSTWFLFPCLSILEVQALFIGSWQTIHCYTFWLEMHGWGCDEVSLLFLCMSKKFICFLVWQSHFRAWAQAQMAQ